MNQNLIFRFFITLSRPLPLLIEWLYTDNDFLVISYPIVMLILAITSLPVHRALYQGGFHRKSLLTRYNAKVNILCLPVAAILFLIALIVFKYGNILALTLAMFFIIEKLGDELSRNFTYEKNFSLWCLFQIARFQWPIIAFMLSPLIGYEIALFITTLFVSTYFIASFNSRLRFRLIAFTTGLVYQEIGSVLPYIGGSLASGLIRQGPRLFVVNSFPGFAHFFVICSQLAQIISVGYNVKFEIPYRKIIAKKPYLYSRVMKKINGNAAFFSLVAAFIALLFLSFIYPTGYKFIALIVFEAVLYAIFTNISGLFVWIFSPKDHIYQYLKLLSIYLGCLILMSGILAHTKYIDVSDIIVLIMTGQCLVIFIYVKLSMSWIQNEKN